MTMTMNNSTSIRPLLLSVTTLCLICSNAFAQAKPDRILSREELRACMQQKQANDAEDTAIKEKQKLYTQEQATVRAEQAELNKVADNLRIRKTESRTELDAINSRANELRTIAGAAKTDEQKAAYEIERVKITQRGNLHEANNVKYNADQQDFNKKLETLNTRISALNERGKTINDGVEPVQTKVTAWRNNCSSRRYREDDEILIKKEMAAKK